MRPLWPGATITALAWENNAFPLYDDMVQRIAKQQNRLFGDRKEFVYWSPGAVRIAEKASAPVKGRSHTIEATLDLKKQDQGVLVACGGFTGGYSLFINDKKVDEVKMPEMHISTFSLSETFDVGVDAGTAVTTDYPVDTHFPYSGKLDKITIRLAD